MLIFALSAAVLAAALAGLMLWRAAGAREISAEAPEAGVYARQLAELDADKAHGLIDEAAWKAARAEAGRRLLKAADGEAAAPGREGSRADRALVLGGAVAAVLLGGAIYVAVGQPQRPDEPFAARMAQWRAHPDALGPGETAAVLKEETRVHPQDPALWARLGAAYFASRQLYPAAEAFEQTTRLAPNDPRGWLALGDTRLAAADGKAEPQVVDAYRHAIGLEPRVADFILAEARQGVGEGHPAEAIMLLRAAVAALPAGDVRKAAFDETIAQAERQESAVAQVLAGSPEQQMQMMRANVARLADRLAHERGDVQAWSMLVRSYGILGDAAARDKALARARTLFAGQDLAAIEAAAQASKP